MRDRLKRKQGLLPPLPTKKDKKPIRQVSAKQQQKLNDAKDEQGDTEKDKFFMKMRKSLTGVCQCGCGQKTHKDDDVYYRFCICHIFPQRLFKSIQFHPLNWVERRFFLGCHANMDNRSMDKWPTFADWNDIKEKFHALAPLLTDQERSKKFYRQLEALVFNESN